jgi:hypothetical protein
MKQYSYWIGLLLIVAAPGSTSGATVRFVENSHYVDIFYTVTPGAEFLKWDLWFKPQLGSILDPKTNQRDFNVAGGAIPVDTFANTVFSSVGAGPASYVFTEYNPGSAFPPVPAQPAPTNGALPPNPDELRWTISDTNVGDGNIAGSFPYHMARVVLSSGSGGNYAVRFFDTIHAQHGETFGNWWGAATDFELLRFPDPPPPNVQLSLNLRYHDPADPTEGGTWRLGAKTDDPDGIAAISAYISNINSANMVYGNGSTITASTLGAIVDGARPYKVTIGTVVNVIYGQDLVNGPIVAHVGAGVGTPGNIATDSLRDQAWNNAALIVTGGFGNARPVFIDDVGSALNDTEANTLAGTTLGEAAQSANTTYVVRGDAARFTGVEGAGKGLFQGDANRNAMVNSADLSLLLTNFNGMNKTWDQGDFNDDDQVNSRDLSWLLTNFGSSGILGAYAISEPASVTMLCPVMMLLYAASRRRASSAFCPACAAGVTKETAALALCAFSVAVPPHRVNWLILR